SVQTMATHVANESWRRADMSLTFREHTDADVTIGDILDNLAALRVASDGRVLIVFAGFYCDQRLLRSLADAHTDSALIDSDPLSSIAPLLDSDSHSFPLLCAALV